MRRRFLPYLPPLLLAVVAVAQFAVANTTPLTAWKLGGFGMFSTSNNASYRVLRVTLETDDGAYVVPGPVGSSWTLTWPRGSVLRESARKAVCGRWRFVPLDSLETVAFPDPAWAVFYQDPDARAQTGLAGFAVPDTSAAASGREVRSARASVVWIRLDATDTPPTLRPVPVAAEALTPAEAGCPSPS